MVRSCYVDDADDLVVTPPVLSLHHFTDISHREPGGGEFIDGNLVNYVPLLVSIA